MKIQKQNRNKLRMTFTVAPDVEKMLREMSARTGLKMSTLVEMGIKKLEK